MKICQGLVAEPCPDSVEIAIPQRKFCDSCAQKRKIESRKRYLQRQKNYRALTTEKKKPKILPTQEELKSLVSYDPETGFWHRKSGRKVKINPNNGKMARISVKGRTFIAAKLAVLYMTGEYPLYQVLYKNGNNFDLRYENLTGKGETTQPTTMLSDLQPKKTKKPVKPKICLWPECKDKRAARSKHCKLHRLMKVKQIGFVSEFKRPIGPLLCFDTGELMFSLDDARKAARLCQKCSSAQGCYEKAVDGGKKTIGGMWGGVFFYTDKTKGLMSRQRDSEMNFEPV